MLESLEMRMQHLWHNWFLLQQVPCRGRALFVWILDFSYLPNHLSIRKEVPAAMERFTISPSFDFLSG